MILEPLQSLKELLFSIQYSKVVFFQLERCVIVILDDISMHQQLLCIVFIKVLKLSLKDMLYFIFVQLNTVNILYFSAYN